uniref:Uncharacterized protein n=1 Tax=Rhizophora mucronata TaxID=61149 RepID=A0A2P2PYU9_RHIMU
MTILILINMYTSVAIISYKLILYNNHLKYRCRLCPKDPPFHNNYLCA